ncbi:MAG: hypothetical protein RML95_06120 [Anaerolineae bacterium]|nr:hypothetical protein [Anaerolineae bacterium]
MTTTKVIAPHYISLSDPSWWQALLALCLPDSIVVCEPTDWHYSTAIVKLLANSGCKPYYAQWATRRTWS